MATEPTKNSAKKPTAKKVVAKKAPAKKTAAHRSATPKAAASKAHVEKPAHKPVAVHAALKAVPIITAEVITETGADVAVTFAKPTLPKGRYVYATGRRKTAVANVRLFAGHEDSQVNKKKLDVYFGQDAKRDIALRPLALTGLLGDFYFLASVNGGGSNAQTEAIRHGIAQALASMNDEMKNVLKKNGFLTRDDRKKERKKPGLRRARRAPQWAKR